MLYELKAFAPRLIAEASFPPLQGMIIPFSPAYGLTTTIAWRNLCLPLLISLSRQSTNASREIRQISISQLSRALLGPHVLCDVDHQTQVEEIFNRVIFPLLDDLLRPQVIQRDPQGMPETRLRASALLCKAFMHFEIREVSPKTDLRIIWIQILDLLDRLMNMDKRDQLVSVRRMRYGRKELTRVMWTVRSRS